MFLITGVFFQQQQWIDTAMRSPDGLVPVIRSGLIHPCYSGVIETHPENPVQLVGSMMDYYGDSELSDIVLTGERFSFVKKYKKRKDYIVYNFTIKDGETWVGEFNGSAVGSGISRCVLVPIQENFFDPRPCVKLLGRSDAHHWEPE